MASALTNWKVSLHLFASIKQARSTILPNPVSPEIADLVFSTPYAARRTGHFEVLMLASPRDFKGVPEFLALAGKLQARSEIRFTLVLNADPDEIAQYLPKALPENIDVHPRTDTPAHFYAGADVLLNLSRVDLWVETFVEGMAFGLPVIAPPVGGSMEIVTHGQEGFLADSRDGNELERLLLTLIDNPQKAVAMSEAARRRARDFTVERFTKALRAQMDLLLSSPANEKNPE